VVRARRADMHSSHSGKFWVGTYEVHQDKAQGTLTSVPFKVTQPYASFLIAGGPYPNTRVELVRADRPFSSSASLSASWLDCQRCCSASRSSRQATGSSA
jgi:hypothetical protein